MKSSLPLEVIGLMGPILCWVEGSHRPGLPESWHYSEFTFEERVRSWLIRELPTYSYDNLDEILKLAGDRRFTFNFPKEPRVSRNPAPRMGPPQGFDLVYIFDQLSKRYFQWAGNELCIHEGRIVELHELALRFPVRHIIQYCHADAVVRGYVSPERAFELPVQMSQLHTTFQSLRTVAEKGLSEGHLHLSGVINADEAWTDHLLKRLSPRGKDGFTPESDRLLVLSRTAVRLLAMGVAYSLIDENSESIPFHLVNLLDKMYSARTPMESRSVSKVLNREFVEELKKLQKNLSSGSSELKWLMPLLNADMKYIAAGSIHLPQRDKPAEIKGIRKRMLLLKRLNMNVQQILIEKNMRLEDFRFRSPGRSRSDGHTHRSFVIREFVHQLACRYLIYHTHHWQKATQSGKTTGLRYFQRFFGATQREPIGKDTVDVKGLAVERLSQAKPLRSVEGRLSPPTTGVSKFMPWILAFAHQVQLDRLDKFGIVVHFRKKGHEKVKYKTNRKVRLDLRLGKTRRITQLDAFRLFRLLSTTSPIVPFIVGIDAANLELTTPPEVFAPSFRFLREFPIKFRNRSTSKEIFCKHKEISALVENRRLGMTYHVGEDFRHILSGLRAIHEVIEFLKPLPGDRLGHAIALALDPEIWASQMGYQAALPMIEWLDNLVWLHYLLGPGHDLIGQLGVEDQIQLYSRKVYGKSQLKKEEAEGWMPITLYDSWRLRQLDPYSIDPRHLENDKFRIRQRGQGIEHKRWADVQTRVLYEVDQSVGTEAAYHLVKLYWYCPEVYEMGNRIITIDMQDNKKLWLQVCREAQQRLQNLVMERLLVVEVNPSSNRIIGPMETMADHPIFKLTLDKQHHLERQIRVTINTDDPGVFATSLPHEYYLLGESLMDRGVPEAEVVEWLDWLRINGKDYSFLNVLPEAKNKHMTSILDYLIKNNDHMLRRLKGEPKKYSPPRPRIHIKTKQEQMEARLQELEKLLGHR